MASPTDRIVVYPDELGDWRWRYVASNGRILADSAEGYRRRPQAMRQAARVCGQTVRSRGAVKWDAPIATGHVVGRFR